MVFWDFFPFWHFFEFSCIFSWILHKIKYPDIGMCKISRSLHFWWFQLLKIMFSIWNPTFWCRFWWMHEMTLFCYSASKTRIFVPKMWILDAETIKNEKNAKFYTSLCLDTFFVKNSWKNTRKFKKVTKPKKNTKNHLPSLWNGLYNIIYQYYRLLGCYRY